MVAPEASDAPDPLGVAKAPLTKKYEKLPGWVPLLFLTYLILYFFGVPKHVDFLLPDPRFPMFSNNYTVFRLKIPQLSAEIWAALITVSLYWIGEEIDRFTFKRVYEKGRRA